MSSPKRSRARKGIMAKEEPKQETIAQEPTIEEHAAALGTPLWALAGVKVRQGWAAEQRVSRTEFERAVSRFMHGPTHR